MGHCDNPINKIFFPRIPGDNEQGTFHIMKMVFQHIPEAVNKIIGHKAFPPVHNMIYSIDNKKVCCSLENTEIYFCFNRCGVIPVDFV